MNVIFTAINAKYMHTNIAVRYFKQLCSSIKNINCRICEYTINMSKDIILQELMEQKPDIICFSCYLWNIDIVINICNCIKKIAPKIIIVLGGPEVSFYDDCSCLPCDYLIKGEGEIEIYNLLSGIANSKTMPKILKSTNAFNIDDLPFPYEYDLLELKNRTLYYEASRGCPFKCSYCLSGSDYGVRYKNTDKIKAELQRFIDADVRQVKFVDRTFNCNKKICAEIWRYIKENSNGHTNFHFEISADILDNELYNILSEMPKGLIQLEVGVQSTNQNTLAEIRRTAPLDKIFHYVDKINKNENVHLHLDLIAGLPLEDYESFKNSFNEVYSHNPQQLQLGMLKLLKGSYLYSTYKNYNMIFRDYAPYEVLSTNVLPFSDLVKLKKVEEVVELFYNSGRFLNIVKFTEKEFASPFDFYQELGNYYFEKGYHLIGLSKESQYEFFKAFYEKNFGKIPLLFSELARFDLICHENPKKIPQWATANEPISRIKTIDYLENNNYSNEIINNDMKQAKSLLSFIHIENFEYDVTNPNYPKEKITLLFNYNDKSILDKAKFVKIHL